MVPGALTLACTGVGLIPVAIILILWGNLTYEACPGCQSKDLKGWNGFPSPENRTIWKRAKAEDDRAFKKNKLILLAVVMVMLAGALVFMFSMMRPIY